MLINEATWNYVRQHVDEDVRKLALQEVKDADVDLQMALQQIPVRMAVTRPSPSTQRPASLASSAPSASAATSAVLSVPQAPSAQPSVYQSSSRD